MTKALLDVFTERQRQIDAEGWTPEHDDEHDAGELPAAGGCYAFAAVRQVCGLDASAARDGWPFQAAWWKPSTSPRRNLVKAAALILAEIERLDRASNATPAIARLVEWRPIEEAEKYDGEFLLYGPSLIDPDFNPTGIVEGHWQDDEGWVGAVWCGCHDCWNAVVIEPTHFTRKPGIHPNREDS